MTLMPKESSEFIVKNAKHVTVVPEGIKEIKDLVTKGFLAKKISIDNFSLGEHHPKPKDPRAANWIFVLDTLNFCFWTPGNIK